MTNLTYKGIRGTRLVTAAILTMLSVVAWLVLDKMTADQFTNFAIWIYGTYAASEAMAKGAEAYSVNK